MDEESFIRDVLRNSVNRAILESLAQLALPDAWLVSGALFQTVWNIRSGRPPDHGIRDYDVFYFDSDTSWQAEDRAITQAKPVFSDLGATVELRNQARVHLWYEDKFGAPYPPLARATDGIDRFLMPCAQVGMCLRGETYDVYAPHGFADIAAMIVRPNPTRNFRAAPYMEKALRWKALWPALTVLPATGRMDTP
jgi:uncharacterized protein